MTNTPSPDERHDAEPDEHITSSEGEQRPARRRPAPRAAGHPALQPVGERIARAAAQRLNAMGPSPALQSAIRSSKIFEDALARIGSISGPEVLAARTAHLMRPTALDALAAGPLATRVRLLALDLEGILPAWDREHLAPDVPDDVTEEISEDLEELEESARQFIAAQPGPLTWNQQRRLFTAFVTATFLVLLMQVILASDAAKELAEDVNLVWPAAAAAGYVAHKHWEKISPPPSGEDDPDEPET